MLGQLANFGPTLWISGSQSGLPTAEAEPEAELAPATGGLLPYRRVLPPPDGHLFTPEPEPAPEPVPVLEGNIQPEGNIHRVGPIFAS
jgi:hypothetical protein